MEHTKRREFNKLLMYIFLAIGITISLYPFYWMITASTLTEQGIFKIPPKLVPSSHFFSNLKELMSTAPIWHALLNSLIVSTVTTLTTIFFSSLAGYAFAKFKFKGRDFLFGFVLFTMMVPMQVMIVPLFITMMKLGWIDSYAALIVPFMITPFGVFLMRQQMLSFPDELIESARIDGSKELGTFFRIVLPTMKPACAALGIVTFMQQWGNFIWPLVAVNTKTMYTLPLMLSMLVQPGQVVHYGPVMTGAVIGLIPMVILFLFFQKYFVSGVFGGSVKG